jgi:Mechanosensitive ion channel
VKPLQAAFCKEFVLRRRHFFLHRHAIRSAVLMGWLWLTSGLALSQPLDVFAPRPTGVQHDTRPPNALYLHNRHIVTFRASLLGDSPADWVALASAALASALTRTERAAVTHTATPDSVRFELNGRTVFFLVAADTGTPRPDAALEPMSRDVQTRLEKAVAEAAELRDRLRIATDLLVCLGASLLASALLSGTLQLRARVAQKVHAALHRPAAVSAVARLVATFSEHAHVPCRLVTNAAAMAVVLLILDTWTTFVLLQFAWTRPWGEQSSAWMVEVLHHFAMATAAAVPGPVVAGLIFVIARMVSRANAAFMHRVQSGDIQLAWLDAHTALPTRRVCETVLWLFAVAMAYPYLPGSETEAFKALSVMTGLMLSLGASSAVGQALSGLSLMYSRSLRVGQHVKIGDTEGTVVALGMFTTRLHSPTGDEVCLPNKLIFGLPIRHLPGSPGAPASSKEPAQSP